MLRQGVFLCNQENRIMGISTAYGRGNKIQDTDGMWASREVWIAIMKLSTSSNFRPFHSLKHCLKMVGHTTK